MSHNMPSLPSLNTSCNPVHHVIRFTPDAQLPIMTFKVFIFFVLILTPIIAEQTKFHATTHQNIPPLLNLSTPSNVTYIFSNHYWWESPDHQITSIVTLLALAKNLSAIPILPTIPKSNSASPTTKSLLGDYFSVTPVQQVQPLLSLPHFLNTPEYQSLKAVPTGLIPFPKHSQEEYESKLKIFGKIEHTHIKLPLPHVDPEHTNQYCDSFPATSYVDNKVRYIFLDRVHFLHFCAERFFPWWYDIRHRIHPRDEYVKIADDFLSRIKKPVAVIHINDILETERQRENEEIERYAREIVDALRKGEALTGSIYFIYNFEGRNVGRVVKLLKQEFFNVHSCTNIFGCMDRVPRMSNSNLTDDEFRDLFRKDVAVRMVEWALGASADLFVGNVHSPYSRNICLHRKSHGKPYSVLRGFGELKKIWKWNL